MDKNKEINEKLAEFLPKLKTDSWEKKLSCNSKEAFLKRLSTFSLLKWNSKPSQVSSLECARNGWQVTATDLLQCTTCQVVLSGKLPKRFQLELYRKSSENLAEQLREAHHKMCPWKNNPTPDSYIDIDFWDKDEIKNEFLHRLDSLIPVIDFLPDLDVNNAGEIQSAMETLQELAGERSLNLVLAQLVIQGWSVKNSTQSSKPSHSDSLATATVLWCNYCIRSIGLWNLNEKFNNHNCAKRPRLQEGEGSSKIFNPISNHQPWCPWVKTSKTGLMGWQTFLQHLHLKNSERTLNSKTDSTTAKPKLSVIRKWLSNS